MTVTMKDSNYIADLFASINKNACRFNIGSKKLEIELVKQEEGVLWKTLEKA
jgi:hypothetical protein